MFFIMEFSVCFQKFVPDLQKLCVTEGCFLIATFMPQPSATGKDSQVMWTATLKLSLFTNETYMYLR